MTVPAIRRGEQTISNPDGDTLIVANDVLVVLGNTAALPAAELLLFTTDGEKDKK